MNAISALLALVVWCATLGAADAIPPQQHRHDVCPGATYFYSGKPPAWAKHMRVACRIGSHVFLTEKRKHP